MLTPPEHARLTRFGDMSHAAQHVLLPNPRHHYSVIHFKLRHCSNHVLHCAQSWLRFDDILTHGDQAANITGMTGLSWVCHRASTPRATFGALGHATQAVLTAHPRANCRICHCSNQCCSSVNAIPIVNTAQMTMQRATTQRLSSDVISP